MTYNLSTKVLSIEHGPRDGQAGAICEPPPSSLVVRHCHCAPSIGFHICSFFVRFCTQKLVAFPFLFVSIFVITTKY
jgi:hypothetical protein